jgi:hypothetical protein
MFVCLLAFSGVILCVMCICVLVIVHLCVVLSQGYCYRVKPHFQFKINSISKIHDSIYCPPPRNSRLIFSSSCWLTHYEMKPSLRSETFIFLCYYVIIFLIKVATAVVSSLLIIIVFRNINPALNYFELRALHPRHLTTILQTTRIRNVSSRWVDGRKSSHSILRLVVRI